jgi:hypothetical protein
MARPKLNKKPAAPNDGLTAPAAEVAAEKIIVTEKLDVKPKKLGKFMCVFKIKENSTVYEVGTEYTGKNAKHFLAKGAIKEV